MYAIPLLLRPAVAALCLLPVLVPTAYLLALQAVVSRHIATSTTSTTAATAATASHTPRPEKGARKTAAPAGSTGSSIPFPPPHSLPEGVLGPDCPYVVSCERVVSAPVPTSALTVAAAAGPSRLLTAFLRATMEAFSWTPQAFVVRGLVVDPAVRHTFDADHIRALAFAEGDVVNGVHQVTYRDGGGSGGGGGGGRDEDGLTVERVELSVVRLRDSPDIVVHVIVVAEVRRSATEAVFVNETWMWRRVPDEKPTLLEGSVGRWLHALLAAWLVTKGVWAVTAPKREKTA